MKFSFKQPNTKKWNLHKTIKLCASVNTEKALLTWFSREHAKRSQINSDILMEKACHFHTLIHGDDGMFTASGGWLTYFKDCHGIQQLFISGEKLFNCLDYPNIIGTFRHLPDISDNPVGPVIYTRTMLDKDFYNLASFSTLWWVCCYSCHFTILDPHQTSMVCSVKWPELVSDGIFCTTAAM